MSVKLYHSKDHKVCDHEFFFFVLCHCYAAVSTGDTVQFNYQFDKITTIRCHRGMWFMLPCVCVCAG